MNRTTWRHLASGLLAATLSLGIAACDDDTTSGGGEMGAGMDMSANVDMATGTPGNGQLTLADVVGTVFTTKAAPLDKLYRTHTLVAVASMPKIAGTPDPSSDFGVTPSIHGCSIYRYTATNPPGADGDAGDITFSGWNASETVGVNAANGSTSGALTPMSGSSPITCKRDATTMLYVCKYNGAAGPDAGSAGATTSSVIYPLVQHRAFCASNGITIPGVVMDQWPYPSVCIERAISATTNATLCPLPGDKLVVTACEQAPILPLGVSQIMQNVAGGTDWPAANSTLGNGGGTDGGTKQLAGPLYVVSVTSGTLGSGSETNISGVDPILMSPNLDIPDGMIDVNKDLNITFSCDPNQPTTAGAGCAGAVDLVGLLVTTSTSPKVAFGVSTATGSATCSQPVVAKSSITVKSAQLKAMIGGQTGGSYQIALVRLTTNLMSPAGNHMLLAFTAGMGVFGFTNQ